MIWPRPSAPRLFRLPKALTECTTPAPRTLVVIGLTGNPAVSHRIKTFLS